MSLITLSTTDVSGDDHWVPQLSAQELQAGLDQVRSVPRDDGVLMMIVARPGNGERRLLDEGRLDGAAGLVGDNWLIRGSRRTPDGSAAPDKQITVMNVRVADLVAGGRDGASLAGDQLYVDFDISIDNLPPGSLLTIGDVVLEVSESPHLGCAKFVARFGGEAMKFVNSPLGRSLRMRGMNTRVAVPGVVRVGDRVTRSLPVVPPQPAEPTAPRTSGRCLLSRTSPGRSSTRGLRAPD
jgi:MOSC domain-containing protein